MGAAPAAFQDDAAVPGEDETEFIGAFSIRPLLKPILTRHLTVPVQDMLTDNAAGAHDLCVQTHRLEFRVDLSLAMRRP